MPGSDIAEALRLVTAELPELIHLPELPERGPAADMTGRGVALLRGLSADLQPAGWRLQDAAGIDAQRAGSQLAQDLDLLEEHTQGYTGRLKIQVIGPWTLAATMERPRGDRVLADFGARRELAQSLTEGISVHVEGVRQRVPGAAVVVQVDEPGLSAVLGGAVPTASGFSRHRSVAVAEARQTLSAVVAVIRAAGAIPVAHVCSAEVPVGLLAESGFGAVSFDLSLTGRADAFATAFEAGLDLWPGIVSATDPAQRPLVGDLVNTVQRYFAELGCDLDSVPDRIVVTPACGLAGASPAWARDALRLVREVATAGER